MRIMGIDYGSKKIGIALTDEGGVMAFPHSVIPNNSEAHAAILALVKREGVEELVIGHSLNKEGDPNRIHASVEAFVLEVTLELGIPVHLEPEQYSTQEALRIQGKHKLTDASAAAIILNSYLSHTHN